MQIQISKIMDLQNETRIPIVFCLYSIASHHQLLFDVIIIKILYLHFLFFMFDMNKQLLYLLYYYILYNFISNTFTQVWIG